MDALGARLARARRFASAMDPHTKPVDEALPALRALLGAAGLAYRIVGGLAVVHHGYVRTTEDIDVIVDANAWAKLDPLLATHDFEHPVGAQHLVHQPTAVRVDILLAGQRIPKPGAEPFPAPAAMAASNNDPTVVSLAVLIDLKLQARRHQDLADIVALLKGLSDAEYIVLEAEVGASRRRDLSALREDAIEELALERP
jgi:hypothetical protein